MQFVVDHVDSANVVGEIRSRRRHEQARPCIRRSGIAWTGGVHGRPLQVELTFENPDIRPTRPTRAIVQIAEFGAFVPWQPLTAVDVPIIPPGGRRIVRTAVDGGDFDRSLQGPRFPSDPQPGAPWVPARRSFLGSVRSFLGLLSRFGSRSADPGARVRDLHMVGNLNVFVSGSRPVERHLRRAIGLRPNVTNCAAFRVGDGARDTYTFGYDAQPDTWEVQIDLAPWGEPVRCEHAWLTLLMVPPANADEGRVTVWVERGSTGQRVPVEFELSAKPSAPQCYRL